MQNTIKDNIPSADFLEAQAKGIIKRDSSFMLNGVEYFTFEKELQMICANRYLLYQQDLQSYQSFGMSMETSRDYVSEMIEYQEKLDKAIGNSDLDMARKYMDDLKLTTMVYKEHQSNFNVISAILELNAIAFIAKCENPFVVDYDYHNEKILKWANALASEGGVDFLHFFWKLSSSGEQNWMQLLMQSTRHLGDQPLSESQKKERQLSENILTLEILRSKKRIQDLLANESSLPHVRRLRTICNYLKLKWNASASLNIFNTLS